jgi:hypothetical protein
MTAWVALSTNIAWWHRFSAPTGFDQPIQAQAGDWQRRIVSAQIRGDVAFASAMAQQAFISIIAGLPTDVVLLDQTVSFPRFRVHVWKNEWQHRTR